MMKRFIWLLIAAVTLITGNVSAGYPASSAFYDNQRATGQFWVTDPVFGGKCDGATDDAAAITAADNAAEPVGGEVIFPAGVCVVNSTITITGNDRWRGLAPHGGSVIRAGAAMQALAALNATTGSLTVGPTPADVSYLTFDGNRANCPNCAVWDLNIIGGWSSTIHDCTFQNATTDLIHNAQHILPLNLSAYSQSIGGGSPSMSLGNFTQPDTSYAGNLPVAPSAGVQFKIKIVTPGALGTATYVLSQDNGATYSTYAQSVVNPSYLCQTQLAACTGWSGLKVAFPVGPYFANDTYALSVQAPEQYAINSWIRYRNNFFRYVGTVYGTNTSTINTFKSSLGFSSPGVQNDAYPAPGTITTVAGNQTVVGSGTTFVSGASLGRVPRPGDFLFVECGAAVPTNLFPILSVLDDTHVVVQTSYQLPTCAASGYYLSTGAGYYETDQGDYQSGMFSDSTFLNVPVGLRVTGDSSGGLAIWNTQIEALYTTVGMSFGGVVSQTNFDESIFLPRVKTPTVQSSGTPYFVAAFTTMTMYSPNNIGAASITGPGSARIVSRGYDYVYPTGVSSQASYTPVANAQLVFTAIPITSGNQTIPAPGGDPGSAGQNSSYVELNPNADYSTPDCANAPVMAFPNATGQVIVIRNSYNSGHVINFCDRRTYSPTHMSVTGGDQVDMWPGEEMTCRAAIQSGTNGWWSCGEVQHTSAGIFGEGSHWGRSSGHVQTTTAAVKTLERWDYSFNTTNGKSVSCEVWGADANNTDYCRWSGVSDAWSSGGVEYGTMVIRNAAGSNAGGCPAAWTDPAFAAGAGGFAGMRVLNVTGVAAHTINWNVECVNNSASSF